MFRSYRGNIWVKKLAAEGINPRTAFGEALVAELTESKYNDIEAPTIYYDVNGDAFDLTIKESPTSGRRIYCWTREAAINESGAEQRIWVIRVHVPIGPMSAWIQSDTREYHAGVFSNNDILTKAVGA